MPRGTRRGLRSRGHPDVRGEPFGDFASVPPTSALGLLRNIRATLISAIALPLAAIPTFWAISALGFSLNLVSLLGITLALHWPTGLVAVAAWLLAMLISRRSSVGGMASAMVTPVASAYFFKVDLTLMFLALALVVLWRHRANIERLIEGTEPRIGERGQG